MKTDEKKNPKGTISPELVARAREGDQAAFGELYVLTNPLLYRSVRAMVHGPDLTWSFDPITGTLTIEGSGVMYDYDDYDENDPERRQSPWFDSREEIQHLLLPDELSRIGSYAFLWCSRVSSVQIPEGLTSIGEGAFTGCHLDSIVIPDSVTQIGSSAFRDCSIRFLSLSKSLSTVAENTFNGCTRLTSVAIPDNISSIKAGAFENCSLDALFFLGAECELSQSFVSHSDSLRIYGFQESSAHDYASQNVLPFIPLTSTHKLNGQAGDNLSWRFDPETATLIIEGSGEMYNYSPEEAQPSPWYYLRGIITSVSLPDGLTSIGTTAFYECAISSIDIPSQVTEIGASAFYGCALLNSVTIPEGVAAINYNLFGSCSSLTSVVIPDSVTIIEDSAFYDCSSLTSITIPEGVTAIGSSAFSSCDSLSCITIPEGVTVIKEFTFSNCASMTSVSIPASVTVIEGESFTNCISLTSVEILEGVTTIGPWAFSMCDSLATVMIAESVSEIGHSAFGNCLNLKARYILSPDCVLDPTSADPVNQLTIYGTSGGAVEDCAANSSIPFVSISDCGKAGDNLFWAFSPDSGTLVFEGSGEMYGYDEDNCPWRLYKEMTAAVLLPDGLSSIEAHSFHGCDKLTSIVIPDSVTYLGSCAFCDCRALSSVDIPQGVITIGNSNFAGCSQLSSVVIPESVTHISRDAFGGCSSLTLATIQNSAAFIGEEAFDGCPSLTIRGPAGSDAEWYANAYEVPFEEIP